ncbi:MAG: hypothetical protein R3F59_35970 [Myxococcota bacterium]
MVGVYLVSALALAGSSSTATIPRPVAGHPVLELRVGADRVDELRHPVVCAEGAPLSWLSFEACGTGAGIWHDDAEATDMAHFRARGRVAGATSGRGTLDALVGAGFLEVQRTARDAPGFRFGRAREPDQVEAAGPELSATVKGRWFVDPGARTFLTADFNVGAAVVPAAPTVMGTGPVIPFALLSVGVGF